MANPDPTAPDPGPMPETENLEGDALIAKWGADLHPNVVREQILFELTRQRMLNIAGSRKQEAEQRAARAWEAAYMKRYGTDEG